MGEAVEGLAPAPRDQLLRLDEHLEIGRVVGGDDEPAGALDAGSREHGPFPRVADHDDDAPLAGGADVGSARVHLDPDDPCARGPHRLREGEAHLAEADDHGVAPEERQPNLLEAVAEQHHETGERPVDDDDGEQEPCDLIGPRNRRPRAGIAGRERQRGEIAVQERQHGAVAVPVDRHPPQADEAEDEAEQREAGEDDPPVARVERRAPERRHAHADACGDRRACDPSGSRPVEEREILEPGLGVLAGAGEELPLPHLVLVLTGERPGHRDDAPRSRATLSMQSSIAPPM